MNASGAEKPIYHNPYASPSLGCKSCPDFGVCGGLYTDKGIFDCQSFCQCTDPSACQLVCPRKLEDFIHRAQEVRGFDLTDIPRGQFLPIQHLPYVVPHVYGRSGRSGKLVAAAVSVPLGKLFERKTGIAKYASKTEVAEAFGFEASAALVINGVSDDQPIEDYWTHRRATSLPDRLAALGPALITVPNYSVFTNVPRWDNLHSIKRIGICWEELVSAGIPASLHLNARTDQDWHRWIDFVGDHPEVQSVAFEFATGAAVKERGDCFVEKLQLLSRTVGRDLQLVIRGGHNYLWGLNSTFSQLVLIDTTSFMKTMKRRRLDWSPGEKKHWRSAKTPKTFPLDALLQHNVDTVATMAVFNRTVLANDISAQLLSNPLTEYEESQAQTTTHDGQLNLPLSGNS